MPGTFFYHYVQFAHSLKDKTFAFINEPGGDGIMNVLNKDQIEQLHRKMHPELEHILRGDKTFQVGQIRFNKAIIHEVKTGILKLQVRVYDRDLKGFYQIVVHF